MEEIGTTAINESQDQVKVDKTTEYVIYKFAAKLQKFINVLDKLPINSVT